MITLVLVGSIDKTTLVPVALSCLGQFKGVLHVNASVVSLQLEQVRIFKLHLSIDAWCCSGR